MPADVPTTGPNLLTPDEKPPVLPVVGTTKTAEGAKAFAKFFVQTIDWGFATVNSAYMRHYYLNSCIACRSYANTIDKTRRAGDRYIGGRITVVKAGNPSLDLINVTITTTAGEAVNKRGKFVNAEPAYKNAVLALRLKWGGGHWTIGIMDVRL